MEEWRDVIGYEGLYQVSNYGLVKSLNYNRTGREVIMMPGMNQQGYLLVCLCKDRGKKYPRINRLVAMAFIPIPDHLKHIPIEQLQVDHIDTDKTNNAVWNLRWTDSKGNKENPLTRQHYSEAHKGMKHTEETKRKMSEARKGEKHYLYGKHHTEETKRKLSEAHKGVPNVKLSKQVLQLDKVTGEVINEWSSASEVERQLGYLNTSISRCCNGKLKSAYGFKWQYA